MKFGVREICDVVLRAKAKQTIGNKTFYKHEPVIYFDTLKTSTLEGAATTVYAQGGAGNPRLIAWEGERTITFTMEDALISTEGFMILSGAGLVDASTKPVIQHVTEPVVVGAEGAIVVKEEPYQDAKSDEDLIYVMVLDSHGDPSSEPIVYDYTSGGSTEGGYTLTLKKGSAPAEGATVLVDYYIKRTGNAKQIEITADKFGGNFYLEASTLFRNTDGVDMPAEFIIPNCKIQSNFTFTMASSGDPSTFTFTMDAFPDYTRFDTTKKVLSAIQIIEDTDGDDSNAVRPANPSNEPGNEED